jgi:hypothetical protein
MSVPPPEVPAPVFIDRFHDDRPPGAVVGSIGPPGIRRQGVDVEGVLGIDNRALRIQPLIEQGWGRAGLVYGPYAREEGLAFAVFLLNGHNTSQAENLPEDVSRRLARWLHGTNSQADAVTAARRLHAWLGSPRKRLMVRRLGSWLALAPRLRRVPPLDENLAVGFFPEAVPGATSAGGSAFIVHALGPRNGALWTRVAGASLPAATDVQNLPLYLVVVLRRRGALYYAASIAESSGLGALPKVRPLAIDPFADEPRLWAGVHQSVLGQIGFRVDSRVYRVQIARLDGFASWCGGAQAADALVGAGPLAGSPADRGGTWQGTPSAFVRGPAGAAAVGAGRALLQAKSPSGLVHALVEVGDQRPEKGLGLAFRDAGAEGFWAVTLGRARAALVLCRDACAEEISGVQVPGLWARRVHSLQVQDDGRRMTVFLDGQPLFGEGVRDERLASGTGIGLWSQGSEPAISVRSFEAHPRERPLPEPLGVDPLPRPLGGVVVATDDFRGPAGDLAGRKTPRGDRVWARTLGPGHIDLTGMGSARVRASPACPNPGRTAYTFLWGRKRVADLEVEITPPGTGRGQGQRCRAGFIFWQDARNYLTVSTYLDDLYAGASISSFFHLDGFEELYDAVWTNVGERVYWGRPFRLRVTFDGMTYLAYVEGEPVLYRALTDIYPEAARLELRRVGLVVNWEWGDDTGSLLRAFVARGAQT